MKTNKNIYILAFGIAALVATFFLRSHFSKPRGDLTTNVNLTPTNSYSNSNQDLQAGSGNGNQSMMFSGGQGFYDDLEIPILMYHHIRNFNDPADNIGTNLSVSPVDFSVQLDLIESRGYETINFIDILNNNIPDKPVILTFDDGYDNFFIHAYPELKKRNMKAVANIIVGSIGKSGYMTAEQIIEISNNDIEIGSHTMSHPDLSTSKETKAINEIGESKTRLEGVINKQIISFCYPAGKFNENTKLITKEAGYGFATTTKSGLSKFDDPFALNRYRVNNGTKINSWLK